MVGGLYLLSGFPTAIARSDPFGISRRFGKPAPPPKFYKPHHNQDAILKKKSGSLRQSRPRPVERRGPSERFPEAEERTLPQLQLREFERKPAKVSRRPVNKAQAADRQQSVRVPQFPSLRPLQFRMPQLPQFRLPSLPSLRRPGPRPRPQSRPQPRPQAPAPASAPEPQQQAPVFRPGPAQAPETPRPQQTRPRAPSPRPQSSPVIAPVAPVAPVTQSRPQPQPEAPVQADFSAFNSDPFSEFQNAE